MGDELPVRRVLNRLQAEGLDRHDAVHAIGAALTMHVHDLLSKGARPDKPHDAYWAELERLTAESWRLSGP